MSSRSIEGGRSLPVEPKAFRVLLMLLRNPQKLITKEELLQQSGSDAPELRHWRCLRPHRGPEVGEMRIMRLSLGLLLMFAAPGILFAQAGATGTILGSVTDTSGAVVPNAKIIVTNSATKIIFKTVTNAAGDYNAAALNPGTYTVSAEAGGFQKSVISSFTLTVNQHARVDLTLRPGAVTETVTTTAQARLARYRYCRISNLVSQQQVEDLPLNGRNFMQLLLVGAGAVTVGGEQGTMRQGEGNAISVNGGRPEGNNYTLDGLVNTDAALVTPAVILSQDAIQEFKVSSGTYSADQGFSATQINIVSKGGTNSLHGAVFWFDRNDAFDAKPFPTANDYISGTPTANPVLRQNQFGFVAGGPIYIPKVYDGRNKSFFMANYEGWRITNGVTAGDADAESGDSDRRFLGRNIHGSLRFRSAGRTVAGLRNGRLHQTAHPKRQLHACRSDDRAAVPGQQDPHCSTDRQRGSRRGQERLLADANDPNQPEGTVNYIKSVGFPLHQNQQTYRGDQNLGKFGSVFFRYTDANYSNQGFYNSQDLVHGYEIYLQNQTSWTVSHTVNFGGKEREQLPLRPSDGECSTGRPADYRRMRFRHLA